MSKIPIKRNYIPKRDYTPDRWGLEALWQDEEEIMRHEAIVIQQTFLYKLETFAKERKGRIEVCPSTLLGKLKYERKFVIPYDGGKMSITCIRKPKWISIRNNDNDIKVGEKNKAIESILKDFIDFYKKDLVEVSEEESPQMAV